MTARLCLIINQNEYSLINGEYQRKVCYKGKKNVNIIILILYKTSVPKTNKIIVLKAKLFSYLLEKAAKFYIYKIKFS